MKKKAAKKPLDFYTKLALVLVFVFAWAIIQDWDNFKAGLFSAF